MTELSRKLAEQQRLRDRQWQQENNAWMTRQAVQLARQIEVLELQLIGVNARLDHAMTRLGIDMIVPDRIVESEGSGAQIQEG